VQADRRLRTTQNVNDEEEGMIGKQAGDTVTVRLHERVDD
jgi:hypothetical protein